MILCIFYTDSPSPAETDSEDELIFNRILEVNKGNAIKVLLIYGLSADLGGQQGRYNALAQSMQTFFLSYTYIREKPPETGHREHLVWVIY